MRRTPYPAYNFVTDSIYCRINVALDKTRQRRLALNAGLRTAFGHLKVIRLDHDRRDDHDELSYGDAAVVWGPRVPAIARYLSNVVSTSRGRASDRHPSNSHDYHDRLSVILLTGLT